MMKGVTSADYRALAHRSRVDADKAPEPLRAALLRLAEAQEGFAAKLDSLKRGPVN